MNLFKHAIKISQPQRFVKITKQIREDVKCSQIENGLIYIFCPHTTAGITINENADPNVCKDLLYGYEKVFPTQDPAYTHMEGNSHAHMKSSAMGPGQMLILENGKVILGTWQDVYFCEFDGPRERVFYVKILEG